jgi:hypothetical protein
VKFEVKRDGEYGGWLDDGNERVIWNSDLDSDLDLDSDWEENLKFRFEI